MVYINHSSSRITKSTIGTFRQRRRAVPVIAASATLVVYVVVLICCIQQLGGGVHAQSDEWLGSIGQVKKDTPISTPTPTPTTSAAKGNRQEQQQQQQALIWSDEFDETSGYDTTKQEYPNPNIWNRDVGVGVWGWGNDEYQCYTDATTLNNAYVQDGALQIVAKREYNATYNTQFTSARLKTDERMFVKYGTIVAKVQIPNLADGLWAGFWTLGQNFQQVQWPYSGEIDIMEIGDGYSLDEGNGNKRVISAVHMSKDDGTYYYNYTWTEARPVDLNLTYHYYKLEWTPFSIEMYVDDYRTHYFDIDLAGNCNYGCEELHQPHFLVLNLAVGGMYTIRQTDIRSPERITAPLPATMKVDYIRIYDNGYTEVSLPGLSTPPTTSSPITASPITAAPISTTQPTTMVPTTIEPTKSPTTKRPVRTPTATTSTPTGAPIKNVISTPTRKPRTSKPTSKPITKGPTRPPTIKEGDKIFNTKAPSNDIDSPSIVSDAGDSKTRISLYSSMMISMIIMMTTINFMQ